MKELQVKEFYPYIDYFCQQIPEFKTQLEKMLTEKE